MKILVTLAAAAVVVGVPVAASAQIARATVYDLRGDNRKTIGGGGSVRNVSDISRPSPYGVYGALPPYEVLTILRSMGFDPQSRPILRGSVYIVRAFDDQDVAVRVAVDARSGRVVNIVARGPLRDDNDPVVGDTVIGEDDPYPAPPRPIPGGDVYRERDYRGPDDRAPVYGTPDYRARRDPSLDYRAPNYRSSDTTIYSPSQSPSSQAPRSLTSRPRVASHAPAVPQQRAKPAPVNNATANAAPSNAVPANASPAQRSQPAATAPATTAIVPTGATNRDAAPAAGSSAVAQDTSRRGTSIPAPVASRKTAPPSDATPPAAKPETSPAPSAGTPLVPVAPLE